MLILLVFLYPCSVIKCICKLLNHSTLFCHVWGSSSLNVVPVSLSLIVPGADDEDACAVVANCILKMFFSWPCQFQDKCIQLAEKCPKFCRPHARRSYQVNLTKPQITNSIPTSKHTQFGKREDGHDISSLTTTNHNWYSFQKCSFCINTFCLSFRTQMWSRCESTLLRRSKFPDSLYSISRIYILALSLFRVVKRPFTVSLVPYNIYL